MSSLMNIMIIVIFFCVFSQTNAFLVPKKLHLTQKITQEITPNWKNQFRIKDLSHHQLFSAKKSLGIIYGKETNDLLISRNTLIKDWLSEIFNNPLQSLIYTYILFLIVKFIVVASSKLHRKIFKPKIDLTDLVSEELTKKKEMKFEVFECEVCGNQLHPAPGRAIPIMSQSGFRCSKCGAKSSSFFNIDNFSDKRAVQRLENIKQRERKRYYEDDEDEEQENESNKSE